MVTLRQWRPLVAFVLYWRDAALQAIDHFERAQKHVLGLHTFSRLSAVVDPAYLEELLAVMQQEKPTQSGGLHHCGGRQDPVVRVACELSLSSSSR